MKMNVTSQIHKFIETSAIADIFNKTMEKDMAYEFLATSHDFVSDVVEDYKLAKEYTCSERSYNFKYKSVSGKDECSCSESTAQGTRRRSREKSDYYLHIRKAYADS